MKSIQTKIISLILVGIIVSTAVIGGTGIISFSHAIDDNSVEVMNLMCSEKAEELNNVLGRIEQSVDIMSVYACDNLESIEKLSNDTKYLEDYTKELEELGLTAVNETDGAVAVYVRFNPEITTPLAGYFKVKNLETGVFEDTELTDFSKYSVDDVEYVGWYYIPVNAGKPVWMQPYYNKNIGIYMISYVIPVYKNNQLFGIVGMDIDFNYITEQSDSIKIYDTGCAFLTDSEFRIVHSRNIEKGTLINELSESLASAENDDITSMNTLYEYTVKGVRKRVAFRKLENGMCLAVTAPVSEIDATKNRLIVQILISFLLIVVVFIMMARIIAKTIVKPLKELDIAARKIAGGNLDVSLVCKSKDEVGTLSESLKEMANKLKAQMEYISKLAYLDKLTGAKNNTAYISDVSVIKDEIEKAVNDFAVFVIDINGLKIINDTYGHEYGNKLIIAVANILLEIFGEKQVYRIGGDEFAVIIKNVDAKKCQEFEQNFKMALKNQKGEIKTSAAIGCAIYDNKTDSSYERVFRRADDEMYKEKLKMKSQGETSSVEI